MFEYNDGVITVTLPEGKTQAELVNDTKAQIRTLIESGVLYGSDIKINGRITTAMALTLGHALAHVCKSVSMLDPKENSYVLCIKH